LINTIIYGYELHVYGSQGIRGLRELVNAFGTVPYELSHNLDIEPYISAPVYVTLLTATFLHGSPLHLMGNMLYLWIFGNDMEDRFGHWWFLLLYLSWGLFASFVDIFANLNTIRPSIGASGAIAGVLGAYMVILPTTKIDSLFVVVPVRLPALILIGQWLVFQIIDGQFLSLNPAPGDNIAYYAHVGGAAAGLMTGLIYRVLRPAEFDNEWSSW